jgi:hypothetical protein
MAEYRAFPVGIDGHLSEPLVCDSDDEAIAKAKRLADGRDIELWCGERLVTRLEAKKIALSYCNGHPSYQL